MKTLLKILSIIAASLLILCLAVAWFLTSEPGEDLLRGWLERRLSAEIGLPVSVGKLETNLWSRLRLDSLVMVSTAGSERTVILYIQHVGLRYTLTDLLGETVGLRALEVDSVALGLEIDSLGRFGIPMMDSPAPEASVTDEPAAALAIDSIMLDRIGLHYLDSQLPLSVRVSGTVVEARGDYDGSYSGRIRVSHVSATQDSLTLSIRDLDAAASLKERTIRIDYARAECEGLHLDATGEVGLIGLQEVALKATAKGSLEGLATAVAAAYDISVPEAGQVSVDCQVKGSIEAPLVSLDGALSGLVLPNLVVDSARVRARYANDEVIVENLRLSVLDGTISGTAVTALDSMGATTLDLTLEGIAFSRIWQTVYSEVSPYRGLLDGTVSVQGRGNDWTSWSYDATAVGRNLRYDNRSIPDLRFSARQESGRTSLSLIHGADEARADLLLGADGVRGTFVVSVPDLTALARFLDQPSLSGGLWANGTVDGPYANPAMSVSATGSKISYRDFPVDTLAAELFYADSQLTLVNFVCEGKLDSVHSQNPPFELDSISGALTYECRMSGTLDHPQGALSARLIAPSYSDYSLDSLIADVSLDGSHVEVKRMEANRSEVGARLEAVYDRASGAGSVDLQLISLAAGPSSRSVDEEPDSSPRRDRFGSVSGAFTLGPDSVLTAAVSGEGLWLGLVSIFSEDSVQFDGDADFDLHLEGPYLSPGAALDTRIRSLTVSGYGVDSIAAHIRLDPTSLWLDSLTSYALGHTLQSTGKIDLEVAEDGSIGIARDGMIQATLDTRDFDLAAVSGLILPEGELAGTFSVAMRVSGATYSPHFDGWLTAGNGRIALDESSPPLENIELSITFADTVFTIDSVSGDVSDIRLRASGSLAVSRFESALVNFEAQVGALGRLEVEGFVSDSSVNLEVVSDTLSLAAFQPFLPAIDSLEGRLGGRVRIEGEPAAPQIDGSLRVRSMAFQSPRHHIRCADGYADMSFDRNRVLVDSISTALNGGRLVISGTLTHDRGEPVDISLRASASHVMLEEPGTYTVAVDSAVLDYGKQNENYVLDGDVTLGETRFTAGLRATSVLPWVQSIETVDMELPELLARSRLDVRIRKSDNLWVDNNLARIRLRAELGVIGTPLRPNLTGLVRIEEGYLLYLDRRFRVNEGSVYFNDPARFNPDINLDASTQVTVYRRTAAEQYTIYIKAEGLLDQLQYGLYSEPGLDRPDIVALLTLGATRSELTRNGEGNGQGGLTQVLKDRAAMLTSQRVSGYLSRRAGAIFGFDSFTIQGNLFQFGDNWGPQLVASKRLSRRIDFTYSTTVGELNDQTVKLGYRLSPRWSLIGETDRVGRSGIDLKFGFTFK